VPCPEPVEPRSDVARPLGADPAAEIAWLPAFRARFERHLNRPARPRDATGEHGLLLGRADAASGILLTGFEPCDGHDMETLAAAAMRRKLARAREGAPGDQDAAIGFYRISPAPADAFGESEIALIRTHFASPLHVFLLAAAGSDFARLFVWRSRQLRLHERTLPTRGPGEFPTPAALAVPELRAPVAPPPAVAGNTRWRARQALPVIAAILLTALGVTLALRYLPGVQTQIRAWTESVPPRPSLGLRVTTAGPDLRVSWNGESPPLKNCRFALLSIVDGSSRREITLSPAQIAGGSVMYHRETDTVQFRLDAMGEGGTTGTEMLVAIGRAPEPVLPPAILPPVPVADPVYVPPQAISKASPVIPEGVVLPAPPGAVTIAVRVSIDERGWVSNAESLAPEDSEPALSDAAERAARLWKFLPARRGDLAVPSQTVLRFRFAAPARTAP